MSKPVAIIIGIGPKNGAAFARAFHADGYRVAMLSRSTELSSKLAAELDGATAHACDAGNPADVKRVLAEIGDVAVLVYNAGSGSWKNVLDTTAEDLERGWRINALGLLTAAQAVIPSMQKAGKGNIVVVGATASLRGKPMTTGFASAKAAQRSLAQSMARQFWPEGIHVSLMIVDGSIGEAGVATGKQLDPRDIAAAAVALTKQPSSAWSFEVDVRPRNEPW
jgi:NAD(P)-dependent dehydrogenase (short-subunit alcohol dehydrogenase family)